MFNCICFWKKKIFPVLYSWIEFFTKDIIFFLLKSLIQKVCCKSKHIACLSECICGMYLFYWKRLADILWKSKLPSFKFRNPFEELKRLFFHWKFHFYVSKCFLWHYRKVKSTESFINIYLRIVLKYVEHCLILDSFVNEYLFLCSAMHKKIAMSIQNVSEYFHLTIN